MYRNFRSFFLEENQGKIKLSQRAVIFLFCLLISSFFWLLSALSKEYNSRLYMPLVYEEPSGSFVLTKDPPSELMVEVRGNGFDLLGEQWSLSRNPMQINLTRAKEGRRVDQYFIPTTDLRTKLIRALGANLNLRYISPDTLYFNTEIRFRKKVEVKADLQLEFESGYNLRAEAQLSPDSVWISGPASFVDTVSSLKTEVLVLTNIRDSIQQRVSVRSIDQKGVNVEPKELELLVPVEKYTEKKLLLRLKQINEYDSRDLKTFPDEVELSFLVPLSKFEYLDTSVVIATVRYTEKDLEKKRLDIELSGIPPYATLQKMETDKVEYIIR